MFNKYAIKHIGSFRSRVANAYRRRVGAILLAVAAQRSVNNLYVLFSLLFFSILFSIFSISLSAFLFSPSTFALPSYSMSLSTSSPNITQDIKVSPVGKTIINPQTVTINSNNPNGIKLFISSKDDKLVPTKTTPAINTSTPISPVPGDISNPSTLNMNSFGFALPNESDNPLSSNFSNNNIYTSNDKNLKNTAKFSKLTNKHNPIEIYQNKSTTTNKQLTVYYGTKINSVIDKGTYTLDILYTLIPNLAGANTTPGQNNQEALTIAESDNNTLELTPTKLTKAQGGESLTINTTINTNLNISNETIANKSILIEAKINNKPCTNIQIEQIASINGNEGNITQTQNTEKQLKLTCTTPPNTPGKYNLTLKIVHNHNPQDTTPNNNINNTNNKILLNINKNNAVEYMESLLSKFTHMQDKGLYQACENTYEHDTAILIDERDNQQYTIAKLKDGKCWMIQNLRLKLSTSTTLTPADTDIASNWTPPRSTKENSGSGGYHGQGGDERWDQDSAGTKTVRSIYRIPTYNTHGVYYTHSAVTAGSANDIESDGQNASHSICPKGWRLPTSSPNPGRGDYWNMVRHYTGSNNSWTDSYNGSHTLISGTPSFPLSGHYTSGGYFNSDGYFNIAGYFNSVDSDGWFWSSTVNSSAHAYRLLYSSHYLRFDSYSSRYVGLSARCVVKEPTTVSDIQHMQDFTSQMCTNMTEHQIATLTDKRDNQQYTIAKLKDGKCWMTQNLRLKLDANKTLTPDDTDLISNYTPSYSTEKFINNSGTYWSLEGEESGYSEETYNTAGVYYSNLSAVAGGSNYINGGGYPGYKEYLSSICPKGWRIPSGDRSGQPDISGEYNNLLNIYDSAFQEMGQYYYGDQNLRPLLKHNYDGIYKNNTISDIGYSQDWWTNKVIRANGPSYMHINVNYYNPVDWQFEPSVGRNLRCISK